MSRIGILELCSLVFLAVIFLEAVQRRQFKRFLVLLIIWIGVTGFALFYLRESTDGLVSFGDDESRIWAFAAILIGAILGIGARYVFYLEQTGKFTWFGLLKPLCISPIVVLPLVASLQSTGTTEIFQMLMFGLLAFQNGFFWQAVLEKAETRVADVA